MLGDRPVVVLATWAPPPMAVVDAALDALYDAHIIIATAGIAVFIGVCAYGASRDRTGDLLLAKRSETLIVLFRSVP